MSHTLSLSACCDKSQIYSELAPQIESIFDGENNLVANLANASSVLKEVFGWFWVGFYLVDGGELVLGPFQGAMACTRIKKGRGVCGTAWAEQKSIVVPDVEQFDGHIACSSASRSEIVVPIFAGEIIVAVLDVDSDKVNSFDERDRVGLEMICEIIGKMFERCIG